MATPGLQRSDRLSFVIVLFLMFCVGTLGGCAGTNDVFRDTTMDFGSIKSVAVLPFANLSKDQLAGERVRDVFSTMLMASGAVYAVPAGEVARGIAASGMANPTTPSADDVMKLAKSIKVDAVISGVVREYGDVRSGTSSADVIALSLQMMEGQTGRIVWSAGTTQGGISMMDRLFGGGGRPLNDITEKAVNAIINKLFE
jgi:polysaccharide biosynthesis protein PelC